MLSLKEEILKFLQGVALDIQSEAITQGRYASGKTNQSLEPEADDKGGILYGYTSVNALETGRKGGAVPSGFNKVILEWMDRKNLFTFETENRRKGIAFLIARKIAKEGTLLYRQGGNSGVLSKAIREDRVTAFQNEVLRKYGREVQNEIITTFTKK